MSDSSTNFYITLPSNSSFKFFPNNTTTHFVTQLPNRFDLQGKWEVALVEIHYPLTFYNVSDGNYIKVTWPENKKVQYSIPAGDYTINELLNEITKHNLIKNCVTFSKTKGGEGEKIECKKVKHNKKVEELTLLDYHILDALTAESLELSPKIAMMLGFDADYNFLSTDQIVARRAPVTNLGLPSEIFVYCDLIDSQNVGDTSAQLLRTIHIDKDKNKYTFGNQRAVLFDSPHYVGVAKTDFETIEIDLRDETGCKLPFKFGTSSVKLHFRKV